MGAWDLEKEKTPPQLVSGGAQAPFPSRTPLCSGSGRTPVSPSPSGLFCEHPPPMVLLQTSPCDQYECQNGAQCIVVQQEPTCRCPPGFAGPRCEKLITVNFVGKDSYVELASAKVRPQANISLQVGPITPHTHTQLCLLPEQQGSPRSCSPAPCSSIKATRSSGVWASS